MDKGLVSCCEDGILREITLLQRAFTPFGLLVVPHQSYWRSRQALACAQQCRFA